MALSAFADRSQPPTPAALAAVLGKAWPWWQLLEAGVHEAFAPVAASWGFAGTAYGWGCKLARAKRTVLHLTPCAGHFLASFALGGKAEAALRAAATPAWILEVVDQAPRYAEGRGVRLPVRNRKAVGEVLAALAIRMAN